LSTFVLIQFRIHVVKQNLFRAIGNTDLRQHLCAFPVLRFLESTDIHVKGNSVLLQAWSGPEGSRKLRFPDFMATAQDGGKVVSLTHRPPLPPGNTPGIHLC
jgi:hypothetical protein